MTAINGSEGMPKLTRIVLPLGISVLLGVAASVAVGQAQTCAAQVPADASNPKLASEAWLDGDFTLTQVPTQPTGERVTTGHLHLASPDSTQPRPDLRRWPDLIGWFEPESATPQWRAIVGSRDPLNPGVTLDGDAMRIGQHYMLDGTGDQFWITAVSAQGFWGWWRNDPGVAVTVDTRAGRVIPDPAGYFCARRVP